MQTNYTIGLTQYDNEREMWETHVGELNEAGTPTKLRYSVWGLSESLSRDRAAHLINILQYALNNRK